MIGPPKKERGLGTALKTAELPIAYRLFPALQAVPSETINSARAAAWEREAARLFREFWRTSDQKHLRAFSVHVLAMRAHETSALVNFMRTPSFAAFCRCFQPTLSPEGPAPQQKIKSNWKANKHEIIQSIW